MHKFAYAALRFKQRHNGSELLTFVAPVGEIKVWAGVPRKHFNYLHGFQRSLADGRVLALKDFYDQDDQNLTPTSIVVAIRKQAISITPLESPAGKKMEGSESICRVTFEFDDLESEPIESLLSRAIALLKARLGKEVADAIERDLDAALAENVRAETSESGDSEERDSEVEEVSLEAPPASHLVNFYSELLGIKAGVKQIEDEQKFRQVLFSILKPAIIVDGQHRVYGAAALDETMNFSVCAIPEADWLEQVFQFVVINQKAKPIDSAFLHAIIATSLTDEEISELYDRLKRSGVDVEKAQYMNKINVDVKSPFRQMIDFDIEGAPGFLKFPGMSRLARDFMKIPKSHPGLTKTGGRWIKGDTWLNHFYAFWWGVREYFEGEDSRLWQEPDESNPNNLLKIVTLQEMQRIVLDAWADSRTFKFTSPSKTRKAAKQFWEKFPATFFTDEWRKKGLQTAIGRQYLTEAILTTRRNLDRKHWGHRKLALFQE